MTKILLILMMMRMNYLSVMLIYLKAQNNLDLLKKIHSGFRKSQKLRELFKKFNPQNKRMIQHGTPNCNVNFIINCF